MSTLPILTYHRLLAESPTKELDPKRIAVSQSQFRTHLRWLRRLGYRTMSLADYPQLLREGKKIPARSFAITFDDGYEDVLTLGLPVLQEFGCTATVFAVPGELGGCNTWDDGTARLLSADQYRTLRKRGSRSERIPASLSILRKSTAIPRDGKSPSPKNSFGRCARPHRHALCLSLWRNQR